MEANTKFNWQCVWNIFRSRNSLWQEVFIKSGLRRCLPGSTIPNLGEDAPCTHSDAEYAEEDRQKQWVVLGDLEVEMMHALHFRNSTVTRLQPSLSPLINTYTLHPGAALVIDEKYCDDLRCLHQKHHLQDMDGDIYYSI